MAKVTRRDKKEKTPATVPRAGGTAEEQIQRAQAAVESSRISAATLHSKWRQHLLRMSYLVIFISVHQFQAPTTYCLYDIKSYNGALTPLDDDSLRISGLQAIFYVINDTLCEFLGVIMGCCISFFLTQQFNGGRIVLSTSAGESFFTNKAYMMATGLVPAVLNFYFKRSKIDVSCLDHDYSTISADTTWVRHTEKEGSLSSAVRGFPVVIVFHVITTVCCWFMEMQQSQQIKNVKMMENFKKELADAKAENASKKER